METVVNIETIEVDFADREGVKNPVLVGPFRGRKVVSNAIINPALPFRGRKVVSTVVVRVQ